MSAVLGAGESEDVSPNAVLLETKRATAILPRKASKPPSSAHVPHFPKLLSTARGCAQTQQKKTVVRSRVHFYPAIHGPRAPISCRPGRGVMWELQFGFLGWILEYSLLSRPAACDHTDGSGARSVLPFSCSLLLS